MAQWERICLPIWEMQVQSLIPEDPLEKEMNTHSSILAWKISWTEEPGGLQSTGSQRDGHDSMHAHTPPSSTVSIYLCAFLFSW